MRGVVYRDGKIVGRLEVAELMPEYSVTNIVAPGPGMRQGDEVVFRAP